MSLLQDYQVSLENYVRDFVTLSVVDVALSGSSGTVLNVDDTATFEVQIHNTGPLIMADVTVRVRGRNGAEVKNTGAIDPWQPEFTTEVGQFPLVPAHNGRNLTTNTGRFSLKAPSTPQPSRTLVDVVIDDWNADFTHVHTNHSYGSTEVKGIFADAVRPEPVT